MRNPYEDNIIQSKELDQYSRFFEPTKPTGRNKERDRISTLVSKETKVGDIKRTDIPCYMEASDCVVEFLEEGHFGLADFVMLSDQRELGLTDSIDGKTRDQILSQKFEYTQKQDITEHVDMKDRKRGFGLRRRTEE